MKLNKNDRIIPVIPFEKGDVKGYFEHRNGRLVWINPYSNEKRRHKRASAGRSQIVQNQMPNGGRRKVAAKPDVKKQKLKPLFIEHGENGEPFNFILPVILKVVDTINSFEPSEIARLFEALFVCKVIVRELGYMDRDLETAFVAPDVESTRLSSSAERKTTAMAKTIDRLSKRPLNSSLKHKLERLGRHLEEAL